MSKISELVEVSRTDESNSYIEINFGAIPNFKAQSIAAITGVVVKGAKKCLSSTGIRHALNGHSNQKLESERGQVAIIDSDFEKIPDILNDYSSVERGNKNRKGFESVVFIKTIEYKEYHVVMGLSQSKIERKLLFNTMFIKNKKPMKKSSA